MKICAIQHDRSSVGNCEIITTQKYLFFSVIKNKAATLKTIIDKYLMYCHSQRALKVEVFVIFLVFGLMFGLMFFGHWMDQKYNVQVIRWLNCEVPSPFKEESSSSYNKRKSFRHHDDHQKTENEELRERIEILEKIVTDSTWELNQKIRNL